MFEPLPLLDTPLPFTTLNRVIFLYGAVEVNVSRILHFVCFGRYIALAGPVSSIPNYNPDKADIRSAAASIPIRYGLDVASASLPLFSAVAWIKSLYTCS